MHTLRLSAWLWLLAIVWTAAVLASLGWNIHQLRANALEQARNELRTNFFKDLTVRRWATRHGGVYVPASATTHPDPYTAFLPERDITTPSGRILTLVNPAAMLRELYDLGKEYYGTHGRISSLHPINPLNAPDEWERSALAELAGDAGEVTAIAKIGGEPHLRLIRPVYIEEECLKCHSHQGLQAGEVGGGVSVSVPLKPHFDRLTARSADLVLGHGLLWLLGLAGLRAGGVQVARRGNERELAYNSLEENEERIRSVLASSLDAIITIDANDYITGWNKKAEKIFGWSLEEIIGRRLSETIIPAAYREAHLSAVRDFLSNRSGALIERRVEFPALHRTGREFPVELAIAAFRNHGKTVFSAFLRDISERRRAEERIQRDYHSQQVIAQALETSVKPLRFKEKLEQVLDLILSTPWLSLQSKGAIFTVSPDNDHLVLAASRGLSESVSERCMRVKFGDCLCGKVALSGEMIFATRVDARHDHVFADMEPHGHYCLPIQTGEKLLGVLNLYVEEGHQKNADEIQFLSAIANTIGGMVQRHQAEEQLLHYAYYDQLTGLPNRALFIDRLQQSVKRSEREPSYRCAVIFLDLDRFKTINDSLGHAAGDDLLKAIARRLEQCVRPGDSIARLGGDEFTVLLDEVQGIGDALRVAQRIHHQLAAPLLLSGQEVFTSASIGIAVKRPETKGSADLLRDADTAMYRAKARGPGEIAVFDAEMHAEVAGQLIMEMEIRRAVERRELTLHYQPILCARTGRVEGFEALVRWQHPTRGLISSADFVPLAEETGLIREIGQWVLTEALRQLEEWMQRSLLAPSTYISVNLSAKQLTERDFLQDVDGALDRFAVPPSSLCFELTESVLMEDIETAKRLLTDLKTRDVKLYMDDFGTGYSSLSYLHQLPFDALKVDRSFVAKIGSGERYEDLINSIVAIARSFGMTVIAEGVENRNQLKRLRELGCEYLQGHHFSRPLTAQEVETRYSMVPLGPEPESIC